MGRLDDEALFVRLAVGDVGGDHEHVGDRAIEVPFGDEADHHPVVGLVDGVLDLEPVAGVEHLTDLCPPELE